LENKEEQMETNAMQGAMNNVQQMFTTKPEWMIISQSLLQQKHSKKL